MNTRKVVGQAERGAVAGRFEWCARAGLRLVATVALLALASSAVSAADLVSAGVGGGAGNSASNGPATDDTGNLVVFYSDASNLVPGDTNGVRDVFLRNVPAGTTERVSVNSAGQQANGASQGLGMPPAISGDGSVVAFYSDASNLVAGDANGETDVFVRVLGASPATLRVSVPDAGGEADGPSSNPSISQNGDRVVFQSRATNLVDNDTNGKSDIFLRDWRAASPTTRRICDSVPGNGDSVTPSISADGQYVAFASDASNLVPDDTNNATDIFVCEIETGAVTRVSVGPNGVQGNCKGTSKAPKNCSILPSISGDGTVVGFKSLATNLVVGDTNGFVDVFVYDFKKDESERTELISLSATGLASDAVSFPPTLSSDGRWVAFGSLATNLNAHMRAREAHVYVRDRMFKKTLLADYVSALVVPGGPILAAADGPTLDVTAPINGDGSRVAFVSLATNLNAADTNVVADVFATTSPYFLPGMCPDGTDEECPGGQVCVDQVCVTPTVAPTPSRTSTPTVTRTPTPSPTPTATCVPCATDGDCSAGSHCRAGCCKIERPCDDSNPAVDRLACFGDREACVSSCSGGVNAGQVCATDADCPEAQCVGLCECGGDCNLDGFVYTYEVDRAVMILQQSMPLSRCVAADINGDGTVTGNEVTLAAVNAGEGCQQEGRPLLYAHDRGGMVTLTVGTVSAQAGGSVSVSVGMSGGAGEVASVQLDLLYDPTVMELDDPMAACVKDPRLTADVLSASLPGDTPTPPGLQRLRLFVGDLNVPIATIADGGLAACTFRIKGDAAGTTVALSADRLNVGDARGNVFGAQALSGGVSILVPSSNAGPGGGTVPACPGDCDGDGEVFVNEVTMGVRILAGLAPLSACPAADADGDGAVFVTDVTRAVLSLATGCGQ